MTDFRMSSVDLRAAWAALLGAVGEAGDLPRAFAGQEMGLAGGEISIKVSEFCAAWSDGLDAVHRNSQAVADWLWIVADAFEQREAQLAALAAES